MLNLEAPRRAPPNSQLFELGEDDSNSRPDLSSPLNPMSRSQDVQNGDMQIILTPDDDAMVEGRLFRGEIFWRDLGEIPKFGSRTKDTFFVLVNIRTGSYSGKEAGATASVVKMVRFSWCVNYSGFNDIYVSDATFISPQSYWMRCASAMASKSR